MLNRLDVHAELAIGPAGHDLAAEDAMEPVSVPGSATMTGAAIAM